MRKAIVYYKEIPAGYLTETDTGFTFIYLESYLSGDAPKPISLTMPLRDEPYESSILFSFFDGLIPEGFLFEAARRKWKIDERDRFGILLKTCEDCIGAVSLKEVENHE